MRLIEDDSDMELSLIATGMHMSDEFGCTIDRIKADGFEITAVLDVLPAEDTNTAMAKYVGDVVSGMSDAFSKIEPDIFLVLGDRGEMLGATIAAAYMNIPVAHVHGGDVSGNVDDPARHAITKFANIHFPATEDAAARIKQMGEEDWRVHVVGAPGLDSILTTDMMDPLQFKEKYGVEIATPTSPTILIVQHPVTYETVDAEQQMRLTLEAVKDLGHQTFAIYPNADAGGRSMIQAIKEYEGLEFMNTFKSLPHEDYLSLMSMASVMVGNSSSGIIEAHIFHLPVVNIGSRQQGRERAGNVMDVGHDKNEIKTAIGKALSHDFKEKINACSNPYGDGRASEKILRSLKELKMDERLLRKRSAFR
jgi:UDP-hydrolysing UDP-N-acetyl-D-glucosamine 2-epimerase